MCARVSQPHLAPWVGVVMLLYLEQDLLAGEDSAYCIKKLMRFPAVQVPALIAMRERGP